MVGPMLRKTSALSESDDSAVVFWRAAAATVRAIAAASTNVTLFMGMTPGLLGSEIVPAHSATAQGRGAMCPADKRSSLMPRLLIPVLVVLASFSGAFTRATTQTVARGQVSAQVSFDPLLFHELRWRSIGPFRGGRTKAAAGIPAQPNVFYIGAVNGGVWKTTDFGRTWNPIFDDQPTGSIGAIAIAPSDPNIIYVGSGEGLQRPD